MKKNFLLIISFILVLFLTYQHSTTVLYKVHKIVSPTQIYIDLNNNLIFDEREPVTIKNLYYLDDFINLYKYPFLSDLSQEQIFLSSNLSKQFAYRLLNNKFVKVKDNEIYINNKKYSDILIDSGLFFSDSKESQENFLKTLQSFNTNDFVLYNTKSKRYHSLSCKEGRKSKNYKILYKSEIPSNALGCGICKKEGNKPVQTQIFGSDTYFETDKIKIFFLDLNSTMKPTHQCTSHACKALKNEIDNVQESIKFAIYGINNQPEIINALINAQKRGVKIQWVCDYDRKHYNYYPDTAKLKKSITSYKTDEIYDTNNQSAIMHNKFFIFDNKKVWTGSSNITGTDLTGFNANYSILIESEELAKAYENEFNQMYNGLFHTEKKQHKTNLIILDDKTRIQPLFSPQDDIIYSKIIPLINNAKKYIYIPIFFFTHKDMAKALIEANNRGVEIKIINDSTNAHGKYSVHKSLRNENIKVKTENYAGKMHAKAMFIDDEVSILGSMNYTKSANNKNDENIIVIYNKEITQYLKQTFQSLWDKIPEKYEHYDPKAESPESIGSCSDGIDNDFDGKIDSQDESCLIQ